MSFPKKIKKKKIQNTSNHFWSLGCVSLDGTTYKDRITQGPRIYLDYIWIISDLKQVTRNT